MASDAAQAARLAPASREARATGVEPTRIPSAPCTSRLLMREASRNAACASPATANPFAGRLRSSRSTWCASTICTSAISLRSGLDVRLFVALEIPAAVRDNLAAFLNDMRKLSDQLTEKHVRWVPPENLHVTLKFIGEVADAKLDGIRAALSTVHSDAP